MGQYRKKPVVIEAFKWTGHEDQTEDPVWIVEAIKDGRVRFLNACSSHVSLMIDTLEGTMEAKQGDWVIRGLKGELYPCKPDIFEASYELTEDGDCGETVYCHGCSVAGGADMPVYHAPPACPDDRDKATELSQWLDAIADDIKADRCTDGVLHHIWRHAGEPIGIGERCDDMKEWMASLVNLVEIAKRVLYIYPTPAEQLARLQAKFEKEGRVNGYTPNPKQSQEK